MFSMGANTVFACDVGSVKTSFRLDFSSPPHFAASNIRLTTILPETLVTLSPDGGY